MDCAIRKAKMDDYEQVLKIMNQAQQLHVEWRPDIYKMSDNLLPREMFEKKIEGELFFVAEMNGKVVGIMELTYRHIETPCHITRNIIYIDAMAVEEASRGKGVGHLLLEKAKSNLSTIKDIKFIKSLCYYMSFMVDTKNLYAKKQ